MFPLPLRMVGDSMNAHCILRAFNHRDGQTTHHITASVLGQLRCSDLSGHLLNLPRFHFSIPHIEGLQLLRRQIHVLGDTLLQNFCLSRAMP